MKHVKRCSNGIIKLNFKCHMKIVTEVVCIKNYICSKKYIWECWLEIWMCIYKAQRNCDIIVEKIRTVNNYWINYVKTKKNCFFAIGESFFYICILFLHQNILFEYWSMHFLFIELIKRYFNTGCIDIIRSARCKQWSKAMINIAWHMLTYKAQPLVSKA